MTVVNDALKEKILDLRAQRVSKQNIAFQLEIPRARVDEVLDQHDPKPEAMDKVKERTIELYEQGFTYEEISKAVDRSMDYVRRIARNFSKSFQPLKKLNSGKQPKETIQHVKKRRQLMTTFLIENGVTAWLSVMRDDQYHINYDKLEEAQKILKLFTKSEIISSTRRRIIVRKIFKNDID